MSWLRWLDSKLEDKVEDVDIRLDKLGPTFKKTEPACRSCGYDAEWLLKLETLERLFCERCLVDALLDAMNFSFRVADSA